MREEEEGHNILRDPGPLECTVFALSLFFQCLVPFQHARQSDASCGTLSTWPSVERLPIAHTTVTGSQIMCAVSRPRMSERNKITSRW